MTSFILRLMVAFAALLAMSTPTAAIAAPTDGVSFVEEPYVTLVQDQSHCYMVSVHNGWLGGDGALVSIHGFGSFVLAPGETRKAGPFMNGTHTWSSVTNDLDGKPIGSGSITINCPPDSMPIDKVVPLPVTFVDECGTVNDKYIVPFVEGVVYTISGSAIGADTYNGAGRVMVAAVALNEHYTLSGHGPFEWSYAFSEEACQPKTEVTVAPVAPAPPVQAPQPSVTTGGAVSSVDVRVAEPQRVSTDPVAADVVHPLVSTDMPASATKISVRGPSWVPMPRIMVIAGPFMYLYEAVQSVVFGSVSS